MLALVARTAVRASWGAVRAAREVLILVHEYVDDDGSIVMDREAQLAHAVVLAVHAARAGGLDRHQVDRVVAEAHTLAERLHAAADLDPEPVARIRADGVVVPFGGRTRR